MSIMIKDSGNWSRTERVHSAFSRSSKPRRLTMKLHQVDGKAIVRVAHALAGRLGFFLA